MAQGFPLRKGGQWLPWSSCRILGVSWRHRSAYQSIGSQGLYPPWHPGLYSAPNSAPHACHTRVHMHTPYMLIGMHPHMDMYHTCVHRHVHTICTHAQKHSASYHMCSQACTMHTPHMLHRHAHIPHVHTCTHHTCLHTLTHTHAHTCIHTQSHIHTE